MRIQCASYHTKVLNMPVLPNCIVFDDDAINKKNISSNFEVVIWVLCFPFLVCRLIMNI